MDWYPFCEGYNNKRIPNNASLIISTGRYVFDLYLPALRMYPIHGSPLLHILSNFKSQLSVNEHFSNLNWFLSYFCWGAVLHHMHVFHVSCFYTTSSDIAIIHTHLSSLSSDTEFFSSAPFPFRKQFPSSWISCFDTTMIWRINITVNCHCFENRRSTLSNIMEWLRHRNRHSGLPMPAVYQNKSPVTPNKPIPVAQQIFLQHIFIQPLPEGHDRKCAH